MQLFAPAKINFTLDVLGKRLDGYHELETVMQTISLGDTVSLFEATEIELSCEHPEVPKGPGNLAYQAAILMSKQCGIQRGVRIHIQKRIPIAAGLAGGSADAAAVLRGLNRFWDLGYGDALLQDLASQLGSDVAFCLRGGTALGKGRGEQLTLLPSPPSCGVILVKQPFAVSTKEVYQRYNLQILQKPMTSAMVSALETGDRRRIMAALGNMLEQVTLSLYPEIADIKEELSRAGAQAVLMSGSGPTVFGLTDTLTAAYQVASRMSEHKERIFVAETIDMTGGEEA